MTDNHSRAPWRVHLYEVIFEAETPAGRAFDIALLWTILLSVLAVNLESVAEIRQNYGSWLRVAEWVFTILFTVEYVLRLICVPRRGAYAVSYLGIIDLLAIIPTYLSFFLAGAQYFLVIRALRLLRVFRILKLVHYTRQVRLLRRALLASMAKITVFLGTVLTVVLIVGTMMYLIEGEANGFTSIPTSVYWAIVTMTTVGYGDIWPHTPLGQALASVLMIMGYAIIAVPTGIVSVELAEATRTESSTRTCPACLLEGHAADAIYCRKCGKLL